MEYVVLYALAYLLSNSAPGQEKLLVMQSPQHLFANAIAVDFDYQLKENSYLIISPQYYFGDESSYHGSHYSDYSYLRGVGIGAANRLYLSKETPVYCSYGGMFNHFDMKVSDYNYPEDVSIKINRFTGTIMCGYQSRFADHLYFDVYCGVGMRRSFCSNSTILLNTSTRDFGYSGTLFMGGCRIGIGF